MRKSTNYVCNNILQIRVFQYYFNEKRKFRPELPCKQVKFSIMHPALFDEILQPKHLSTRTFLRIATTLPCCSVKGKLKQPAP